MFENIQLAFQGVFGHKLRSFLTMLGIIIGIASIITIISTIKGTNEQIKQNLIGSGSNIVNVQLYQNDWAVDMSYQTPDGIRVLQDEQRDEMIALDGVADVTLYRSRENVEGFYYRNTGFSGKLYGVDDHYFSVYGYEVRSGRGFTARAIRNFIDRIGYTKIEEAMISVSLLEHAVREDLNAIATRAMAVINPVKVVITNYPEGQTETVEMENNPEDPQAGTHSMPFSREIYIERDDFMENPPKKFFRLAPGSEVRLKGAYIIKCEDVKKDADGNITEILCTYDPESRSGLPGASRKVKGTLHWVSAAHAKDATVRLYDRLFSVENPSAETDKDFRELLNPGSLVEVKGVKVEPFIAENAEKGCKFQFQRVGYFTPDYDSTPDNLIFNRTIALKDSWEKAQAKG